MTPGACTLAPVKFSPKVQDMKITIVYLRGGQESFYELQHTSIALLEMSSNPRRMTHPLTVESKCVRESDLIRTRLQLLPHM